MYNFFKKKKPTSIKESELWKRRAEGLEALLKADLQEAENALVETFREDGSGVTESTPESAQEKGVLGRQSRQEVVESEAIVVLQDEPEFGMLQIAYWNRVGISNPVPDVPGFQLVPLKPTTDEFFKELVERNN